MMIHNKLHVLSFFLLASISSFYASQEKQPNIESTKNPTRHIVEKSSELLATHSVLGSKAPEKHEVVDLVIKDSTDKEANHISLSNNSMSPQSNDYTDVHSIEDRSITQDHRNVEHAIERSLSKTNSSKNRSSNAFLSAMSSLSSTLRGDVPEDCCCCKKNKYNAWYFKTCGYCPKGRCCPKSSCFRRDLYACWTKSDKVPDDCNGFYIKGFEQLICCVPFSIGCLINVIAVKCCCKSKRV